MQSESNSCYFTKINGFLIPGFQSCFKGLFCPNTHTDIDNFKDTAPPETETATETPIALSLERRPKKDAEICIPSLECELSRLNGQVCRNIDASFGAQGIYEPVLCPPGYYCQTPSIIKKCPEGYYCPTGSFQPLKCDYFSICPSQTTIQQSYTGLIICFTIDLLLLLLYFIFKLNEKRKERDARDVLKYYELTRKRRIKEKIKGCIDIQEQVITRSMPEDEYIQVLLKNMEDNGECINGKLMLALENVHADIPPENNFGVHFKKESSSKRILAGINLEIKGGTALIIGPSGCGKTTLLRILAGRSSQFTGTYTVNDRMMDATAFMGICGYVPQNDLPHLPITLTPRETILYSARVRLAYNHKHKPNHKELTATLLGLFNLMHVADLPLSNLSGGERKRVSIAVELAALPRVVCMDEPTTGLDAWGALEVMRCVLRMSESRVLGICVLHQPRVEIFRMFERVVMMSKSGRIVYDGETIKAKDYFKGLGFEFMQGANECDVMVDIIGGMGVLKQGGTYSLEELDKWWQIQQEKVQGQDDRQHEFDSENVFEASRPRPGAPFINQLYHMHNLYILHQYRHAISFFLEISVCAFIGTWLGLVMSRRLELYIGVVRFPFSLISPAPNLNDIAQTAFITFLCTAFSACPMGVLVFYEEGGWLIRGLRGGSSASALYLSRNIATVPRILMASLHFASFSYWFSRPVMGFFMYWLLVFGVYFAIYGVCFTVALGGLKKKRGNGHAVMVAVTLVIYLGGLSGYGPTLKKAMGWGLGWLWDTSYYRWAIEVYLHETLKVYEHVYDNFAFEVVYGYTMGRGLLGVGLVGGIGLFWRLIGFCALLWVQSE